MVGRWFRGSWLVRRLKLESKLSPLISRGGERPTTGTYYEYGGHFRIRDRHTRETGGARRGRRDADTRQEWVSGDLAGARSAYHGTGCGGDQLSQPGLHPSAGGGMGFC